ncbi:MAG: (d)CMP kinase [Actinobacteria bacterium]|nr:(d)CMP kinase [Actinomycetota bacterium]
MILSCIGVIVVRRRWSLLNVTHLALRGRSHVPLSGVIALDGPSGTGKSSVAQLLAESLGARYLDTGAMYRAVTWAVLRSGAGVRDAAAVADVVRAVRLSITTDPCGQQVMVDGRHVEGEIRSVEVTAAVSEVSAVPVVRARLVALQRELIGSGGIVVEGRDIGTVVWPTAELKVFLTAHPAQRAMRRARQVGAVAADEIAATAESIERRDSFDSSRAISPLRPAADATVLDTTELTRLEVVRHLLALADQRGMVSRPGLPGRSVLPGQRGPATVGVLAATLPDGERGVPQ